MRGEAQVYVEAPPEQVWQLVTDVTRMGDWSPECRRCEWERGHSGPVAGARFRGHNRRGWLRWSMPCAVTEADKDKTFAFETVPAFPFKKGVQTRWRFEFQQSDGGTTLTESFEVLWYSRVIAWLFFGGSAARLEQMRRGLADTLARIKAAAEAS